MELPLAESEWVALSYVSTCKTMMMAKGMMQFSDSSTCYVNTWGQLYPRQIEEGCPWASAHALIRAGVGEYQVLTAGAMANTISTLGVQEGPLCWVQAWQMQIW